MSGVPKILNHEGQPMRADAFNTASDRLSRELQRWQPWNTSADTEWNFERDTAIARIHDQARNDGWISGMVTRAVDQAIGAEFRVLPRPDWRALGLTFDWAVEWSHATSAKFRTYCNDPRNLIDAAQGTNFAGLMGQAYRHDFMDGESVALSHWMTNPGRPYATAIQLIDPDRLSNPNNMVDVANLRGGIEVDAYGAAMAYHFRKAHPGDSMVMGADTYTWARVPKYVPGTNRLQVIHHFDRSRGRAGQTRGRSIIAPIVQVARMGQRYTQIEMQQAIANAIFAVFLKSPFDHNLLTNAVSSQSLDGYQDMRAAYHAKRQTTADGAVVVPLFPGEEIGTIKPEHPNAQYGVFMQNVLRHMAAATGQSYEQIAQDWSQTNYSSARAALMESWKFLIARRGAFNYGMPAKVYLLWLEEAVDKGEVELPPGTPAFWDMPAAWARHRCIGPGRGWIDPVKEAQSAQMRMDSFVSTLEDESADQGKDYEETLEQAAYERAHKDQLGLPLASGPVTAAAGAAFKAIPDNDAQDAEETQQQQAGARARANGRRQ